MNKCDLCKGPYKLHGENVCIHCLLNPYVVVTQVSDKSYKRYIGMTGKLISKTPYAKGENALLVEFKGLGQHIFYDDEVVKGTV